MTGFQVIGHGLMWGSAISLVLMACFVLFFWRALFPPRKLPTPHEIIAATLRASPELQRKVTENNAVLKALQRK